MERISDKGLDQHSLLKALSVADCQAISSCTVFDSIDSTNSYLLRNVPQQAASGLFDICCAETQTGGRGRMGRNWDSPRGGIYLSVLSDYDETVPIWLGLTAAFEVAAVLEDYGVAHIGVKWPNDIYCAGGKLGGILVERKRDRCVVGIGLNYGYVSQAQSVDYAQVCLEQFGLRLERNVLTAALISVLISAFAQSRQADRRVLMARYARFDCLKGRAVRVFANDGTVSDGIGIGIAENAGFCVEYATGRRIYQAGEVSIRQ